MGQLTWLDVNGKGRLLIKSGNETIGRDRRTQTLLVVYRNKEYLIAGIAYTARDTLDAGRLVVCDGNFLTGKGLRNSTPNPCDAEADKDRVIQRYLKVLQNDQSRLLVGGLSLFSRVYRAEHCRTGIANYDGR